MVALREEVSIRGRRGSKEQKRLSSRVFFFFRLPGAVNIGRESWPANLSPYLAIPAARCRSFRARRRQFRFDCEGTEATRPRLVAFSVPDQHARLRSESIVRANMLVVLA